jgi:hypothetical protein
MHRGSRGVTQAEPSKQSAQRGGASHVALMLTQVKRLTESAFRLVPAIGFGAGGAVQRPEFRVRLGEQRGFTQCNERLATFSALLCAPCTTEQQLGA